MNSSTYAKELFAITVTVQKWRHYILGNQFIVDCSKKFERTNEPGGSNTWATILFIQTIGLWLYYFLQDL